MMMLLVAGPPGAGKCRLAEALGERLGWPMFSKDRLKTGLLEATGMKTQAEKDKICVGAVAAMCYAAESVLNAGGSLILESNFESRDLPLLKSIAERYRAYTVTIRLDADDDTLFARFSARQQGRHRPCGHIINGGRTAPEEPAIPREEYIASIEKRGIRRFALGQLIPVDSANPDSIDIDALLTLAKNTSFQ